MPAEFWIQDEDGTIRSDIITGWDTVFSSEEYRQVAEDLDELLDDVLDKAVSRLADPEVLEVVADHKFKMLWTFGRTVKDSGVLRHQALASEKQIFLWRVIATKARLGIFDARRSRPVTASNRWRILRDPKQPDVTNKGGGVQDLYETAIWLQQHDLDEAAFIFGGNLGNAREIGARKGINVPQVRHALCVWLRELPESQLKVIHQRKNFQLVAKALTKQWPFKGFGSARRPEHLHPDELIAQVRLVLHPVLDQLFGR